MWIAECMLSYFELRIPWGTYELRFLFNSKNEPALIIITVGEGHFWLCLEQSKIHKSNCRYCF